ncbi:MAG: tetratricopeptide repeat protein, partial [Chloroflexota bacterium]
MPPTGAVQDPPGPGSAGAPPASEHEDLSSTPAEVVRRLLALEDEPARHRFLGQRLGACDAEELLVLLKAESERYWHVDPHISLRAAETLIDAARLAGQPYHEALGLMAKGDALRFLGRYPESLPFFERAAEAFLAQGHEVGWARTRIGWLHTMHLLGRGEEALAVAERAREILIGHEE